MIGAQVRMARAALKMGVRDLAAVAQVSPNTITRIEADLPSNASTLAAIRRALEAAGVEFINGEHPGVRMWDLSALPTAAGSKPIARKKAASKPAAGKPRRSAKK
jgi:transcriptional regulator with XRE-family HTH domain